jgi:hypothetical protein
MTVYIARFGGSVVFLIAVAVGVLVGRVIEAIAVGALLFTVWTYVARLVVSPDREPARDGDGQLG